jgi:hypothetical protein
MRGVGRGDTLPIDDARSPLARPIAPLPPVAPPASPVTLGPGSRSPASSPAVQPVSSAAADTLPIDGAAMAAALRPITPRPPRPPPRADQTARLAVVDSVSDARSFYVRLGLGVLLGGLALGALVTALLASFRH